MGARAGSKFFSVGPFDPARFAALSKGLEVSALRVSEVLQDNALNRIDSTFFTKKALLVDATLRSRSHATVSELATSVLSFGAYALTNNFSYVDEGIPFLRCTDIRDGFVSFSDCLFIDAKAHELLQKSAIEPETVLLSMSGSVGNAAVALPSWKYPVNSNQDLAKIKTTKIDPYYLAAFFGSSYGQVQMGRLPVGSVQQHIFLSMIETLLVARFGCDVENGVSSLMKVAYSARDAAAAAQKAAEETLLGALGLQGWSPPEPLAYTRSASDVAQTGRLDSAFHSPRVQAVLARLGANGTRVEDFAQPRRELFRLAANIKLDYIEISNLGADGRAQSTPLDAADAPSRAKWIVRPNDVLTSTVRPLRRLSALVMPEQDGFVASSGFLVLEPTQASARVLLSYLRLPIVCELMDMFASASMYPAIADRDILALPMPSFRDNITEDVDEAVAHAHEQADRSAGLLAAATRAIELAVEEGESAALAYLAQTQGADNAVAA